METFRQPVKENSSIVLEIDTDVPGYWCRWSGENISPTEPYIQVKSKEDGYRTVSVEFKLSRVDELVRELREFSVGPVCSEERQVVAKKGYVVYFSKNYRTSYTSTPSNRDCAVCKQSLKDPKIGVVLFDTYGVGIHYNCIDKFANTLEKSWEYSNEVIAEKFD